MMLGPGKWAKTLRDAAAKEFAGQAVAGEEGQGDSKGAYRARLKQLKSLCGNSNHTFSTSHTQLEFLAYEIDCAVSQAFCKRARL